MFVKVSGGKSASSFIPLIILLRAPFTLHALFRRRLHQPPIRELHAYGNGIPSSGGLGRPFASSRNIATYRARCLGVIWSIGIGSRNTPSLSLIGFKSELLKMCLHFVPRQQSVNTIPHRFS